MIGSTRRTQTEEAKLAAARASGGVPPEGYEPLAVLAHGHRCITWDAWDAARDCRVVVKVLRADRLRRSSPETRRRLVDSQLTEGRLMLDLGHPHLVRAYEVIERPLPTIVMETLGGSALDALIEDAPVGVEDAALLGLQVSSALGWLHHHGWLHLDLKPPNVVVESGRAKVIDLGLAGRPGDAKPGSGTRGYLAPEQAVGRGLSAATDVWGLGVMLVESLTGDLPFGDEATWESRRRWPVVHRRMPRSPEVFPEGLPEAMDELLRGCVALDPDDRPTLSEVRTVLRQHADDR